MVEYSMVKAITTIQVYTETKDKLRKLGQKGEHFDSIINRAIGGEFANQNQKVKPKGANK